MCAECEKEIKAYNLAFYCLTDPIRIRKSGYAKVCVECGLKLLSELASVPKAFGAHSDLKMLEEGEKG